MIDTHRQLAGQNIVIVRRYGSATCITIPLHVLEALTWQIGDFVRLNVKDGKLIIERGEVSFK